MNPNVEEGRQHNKQQTTAQSEITEISRLYSDEWMRSKHQDVLSEMTLKIQFPQVRKRPEETACSKSYSSLCRVKTGDPHCDCKMTDL